MRRLQHLRNIATDSQLEIFTDVMRSRARSLNHSTETHSLQLKRGLPFSLFVVFKWSVWLSVAIQELDPHSWLLH